jgi:hypothetical protein
MTDVSGKGDKYLLITVLDQVRRHENEHEPVNEVWKEATESDGGNFG